MNHGRKLSDEHEQSLAAEYTAGASVHSLAKKWRTNKTHVGRVLRRAGVSLRPLPEHHSHIKAIPAGDEPAVVARYLAGETLAQLASAFGRCSLTTIRSVLVRLGVPRRKGGTRHLADHEAFSRLPTDHAARYWLGVMLTDGCVRIVPGRLGGTSRLLTLTLAGDDRMHVDSFRDFLRATHKLVDHVPAGGRQPFRMLSIYSERLVSDLMRHGVIERKSGKECAHELVADCPDFWRGCVDGDGYLTYRRGSAAQPRRPTPAVGLVGSLTLTSQFRDFVKRRVSTDSRPNQMGTIWNYSIAGANAVEIIRELYGDRKANDSPALPRKVALAKEMMAWK